MRVQGYPVGANEFDSHCQEVRFLTVLGAKPTDMRGQFSWLKQSPEGKQYNVIR